MQLHQIKLDFVPEQDRLLMRISTRDNTEVLLWLTRRCVKMMWPVLLRMVQASPRIQRTGATAEARAALLGMEHERAMLSANFSRPYEEATLVRPLGDEPMLVTRMQGSRDDNGQHVLTLLPAHGKGVHVRLDDSLLHSCCRLVQNAVTKAGWDFTLEFPQPPLQPGAQDGAHTVN